MHAHSLANMSPRCSLRYALSVVMILDVIFTNVSAFAIRSSFNTTRTPALDLAVDESLQLEVRHDLKRPNDLKTNIFNKSNEVPTSTTDLPNSSNPSSSTYIRMTAAIKYNPDVISETIDNNMTTKNNISERSVLKEHTTIHSETNITTKTPKVTVGPTVTGNCTTHNYVELTEATQPADMDNSMSLAVENINVRALNDTFDLSTTLNDTIEQIPLDQLATIPLQNVTLAEKYISTLPVVNSSDYVDINTNFTARRKYTVIDRITKVIKNQTITPTDKYEKKAESLVTLTSATSEEVLRRVATEYSIATTPTPRRDVPGTTGYPDVLITQEIENITNPFEVSLQKPKFESVSSKRAGFLNYSSKSKQYEATSEVITTETAYRDHTTLALENDYDAISGRTTVEASKSQSYLDEDAIKEEMLQETSLKNNEEMAQQIREGHVNNTDTTFSFLEQFSIFTSTQDLESTVQTNTEEIINTKPSQDKGKSTVVYTVSPNYKPMKKLEIQPPKQFVRDPDDNSWRNESISSLGIVFKPKNSSKPFTQVLKNKTETEWSNLVSRDSKSEVPDLRERLEKIAQKRKTKKKKTDYFGNIIYSDYEETNSSEEVTNTRNIDITHTLESTLEDTTIPNILTETVKELSTLTLTTTPTTSTPTPATTVVTSVHNITQSNTNINSTTTTAQQNVSSKLHNKTKEILSKKGKYNSSAIDKEQKYFNVFDYYDISNEDESEYLQLAKLELKKYSVPTHFTQRPFVSTAPLPYRFTKPETLPMPERKATIQYFPPRINTNQPKPNRFDKDRKTKIKSHTKITSPKEVTSFTLTNSPETPLGKYSSRYQEDQHNVHPTYVNTVAPIETPNTYNSNDYTRYLSQTEPPRVSTEQKARFGANDHTEGFHRASYVMKNYKDFIEQAAKDYDYERDAGLMTYTPPPAPVRGVTISDLLARERDRPNFNEDYDSKFRKDVMQRFVDNFNHNDARYHANSPVLYNNTVMHANTAGNSEAAAASRAFLKGLYSPVKTRAGYARREPYDPACDNVTVELSPAYELHYYVPEQEEIESKSAS